MTDTSEFHMKAINPKANYELLFICVGKYGHTEKKQYVVAQSGAEAEFRAKTHYIYEGM